MDTSFQMAFHYMSSMMASSLIFILVAWKKDTIDKKAVIEFANGILHTYMMGFIAAAIVVGLLVRIF